MPNPGPSDVPQGGGSASEWLSLNQKLKALEQRQRELDRILKTLGLEWVVNQLDAPGTPSSP
jgi:hypothetical protein